VNPLNPRPVSPWLPARTPANFMTSVDVQPACSWAGLKVLGQPCGYQVPAGGGRGSLTIAGASEVTLQVSPGRHGHFDRK
jgi:hypothetical protein